MYFFFLLLLLLLACHSAAKQFVPFLLGYVLLWRHFAVCVLIFRTCSLHTHTQILSFFVPYISCRILFGFITCLPALFWFGQRIYLNSFSLFGQNMQTFAPHLRISLFWSFLLVFFLVLSISDIFYVHYLMSLSVVIAVLTSIYVPQFKGLNFCKLILNKFNCEWEHFSEQKVKSTLSTLNCVGYKNEIKYKSYAPFNNKRHSGIALPSLPNTMAHKRNAFNITYNATPRHAPYTTAPCL